VICCGYKGHVIKQYFADFFLHQSDVTFDLASNKMDVHSTAAEDWKITLVDTGKEAMTGGRIKQIEKYVGNSTFMLTYGDGVSNINIAQLLEFHKSSRKSVTVTAVQPESRFGILDIKGDGVVNSFLEKPKGESGWINGGFFVCEPSVFSYIDGMQTSWEREPLERLAQDRELVAYKHSGFWKPMDTLKDKQDLNRFWEEGSAEWKIWK